MQIISSREQGLQTTKKKRAKYKDKRKNELQVGLKIVDKVYRR